MKTTPYLKAFVLLFGILVAKAGFAQNVGISSTSSFTPDASAGLDVSYTNKGLLVPRVALTATNAAGPITSPATSLLVYNTATAGTSPNNVTPGYYYWNGTAWTMLTTSTQTSSLWATIGNAGTSYPTNFLGTTDNFGLHFKTNNTHRFWLDSLGSVSVGLNPVFTAGSARERFLVDAGSTSANPTPTGAFNVISGKGYLDSYLQLNIQNNSPTAAASSDIVASNDAATETTNYVDMGINSSANTSTGVLGGANTAYLYGAGNDFAIGNSTSGKNLLFFTGGTASNERMRIDGTGNIGIGNTAPTQKVDITGNLKFSGALMPNNNAGTAGYFLISSGANAAPTWYNATAYINTAAWVLAGNAGTTAGTNFIGTTDAVDFVVKTSNTERARVNSTGSFGIGSNAFNTTAPERLLVDAGATSYNVISGKGNLNNYLQLNIQNTNAGTGASSDVVATNDAGTEANGLNYIDMGVNSSGNTSTGVLGGANTAYLYSTGNDLAIGNAASGKNLLFFTGGTGTNERMRVDGTGNVGIANNAPTEKLDITGNLKFSGALMPNNNAGTAGYFLQSSGSGAPPVWFNASNLVTTQAWSLTGNAGTTAGTNFIGTTDATDFVVKTNSIERARVTSAGNIGIGTIAPSSALHVVGTNPLTLNGVQTGTNTSTDSLLTLSNGVVRKLPLSNFAATANAWSTTGNAGTTAGTNFIGTTDATDFIIKTNNAEVARFNSAGNVAIGGTAFNSTNPEQLLVDAGTSASSYNVISGKGTLNNYLQLNIQNNSSGTGASSDIVASNNIATESANYIDMGINSSGNTSTGVLGGASTAYLYGTGNDFAIGNGTSGKNLLFFTGGTGSTERMRINSTGYVGITNTNPLSTLDVIGSGGYAITTVTTTSVTLGASHYTVIITPSAAGTVTLPAASSTTTRRIYIIVNQNNTAKTLLGTYNYVDFSGTPVPSATTPISIPANSSITIQSSGTNWYRIQ
ncbi:beta strand repeat-containing protein [Mucilaginibacter arboris]|uniref:Uncharacterized protein n=1 Tax=Mucilaginibacter arboris TaxID=2682090 RepID=A0A7K1SX01_9SPHI|nr:hypothetical protein [Mucilaginibacter arboris]MVN21823.1 hypothetical protein [Mucilaginibacter arboris]